jgi:flagellar motor protein MotB
MKPIRNNNNDRSWLRMCAALGLAVALCSIAPAQETPKPPAGDELPDKVELNGFGGGSFFRQVDRGLGTKLVNGGAAGFRVTENFWKYFGLEQGFTYSVNNVRFLNPNKPGLPNFEFGHRIYQYSFSPVYYFSPRGSKIRPFLAAGFSALNFAPIDSGRGYATNPNNSAFNAGNLGGMVKPALNYGGGIKIHLTDHFGLRFDIRGLTSGAPTWRLPQTAAAANGGVYVPRDGELNGVQTTAGLTYYFGSKYVPPPPVQAPQPLGALNAGSIVGGAGALCQGRAITVRSTGASDPAGRRMTYKWKVNGQPMGSDSPELTFTPDRAGNYTVELDLEAPNTENLPVRTAKANTLSLGVQEYKEPTVSAVAADPATLAYGQNSAVTAQVTGSSCSTVSVQWTAAEGSFASPTSANTKFDTQSVRFEQGGKIQSKTIALNIKATDDRGATANGSTSVKVDFTPNAIRFGDVVFAKGSARVNNCGKRVLIEELAPKAADPDYEVVLVGHIDKDEVSKTKKASTLDMQRVANAYAVLTAGGGTCANVDPSRIKVDWTGTEQVSEMQPGLCGTTARTATKERRGSMVSTADENRRVEVWLVPKGTKLPAGFHTAKSIDPKLIKKLSCPK